jgi:hypothetical protein
LDIGRYNIQVKKISGKFAGDGCCVLTLMLMNVFCTPGVIDSIAIRRMLGITSGDEPIFGWKALVPLTSGRFDRTEVDMRWGDLLVEAKLTESDFQRAPKATVRTYRDFSEVFDTVDLPQTESDYLSYQLIRNVLAAYASGGEFCVLTDARRPELIEDWYAVMKCVRSADLRIRCKVLTWQELAKALPSRLQEFLDEKYGIGDGGSI